MSTSLIDYFKHRGKMLDKRVAGLRIASEKKKQGALLKTKKAIAFLVDSKQKVTVRSVAKQAGVSVSYIYKHPEIAYSIQRLREQQKYSLEKREKPTEDVGERIKLLQQERDKLAEELNRLKASIEQANSKKIAKHLQAENIKLTIENQQLKQELEYTRQNLQQARQYILSQRYDDTNEIRIEAE